MRPVCIITGAGGRLGEVLCQDLRQRYDIIAVYRSRIPRVASQLRAPVNSADGADVTGEPDRSIFCVEADLTKREDIRRVVELSLAKHGRIDAIINSAADIAFHGKLTEIWQADNYAQSQLYLNCIAPMQLASAIFDMCWKDRPAENARWNRSVVNVSSMSGLYVYPQSGQAFYGASKAALNMLTLYLASELASYSIRVNAICPGRFSDLASTRRVVNGITELMEGESTGILLTKF